MGLAAEWLEIRGLIEDADELVPFRNPDDEAESRLKAADKAPRHQVPPAGWSGRQNPH